MSIFKKFGDALQSFFSAVDGYYTVSINGDEVATMTHAETMDAIDRFKAAGVRVKFYPMWNGDELTGTRMTAVSGGDIYRFDPR